MPAGEHAQHSRELGSMPRRKRSALQAGSLAAGPGLAAYWLPQAGVTNVLRGPETGARDATAGVGSEAARQGPASALGQSSQVSAQTVGSERGWKGRRGRPRRGCSRVARGGSCGGSGARGRWGKRNRGRTAWERDPGVGMGLGGGFSSSTRPPPRTLCVSHVSEERQQSVALQLQGGKNNRTAPDQAGFSLRGLGLALSVCCEPLGKLLALSGLQFPSLWFFACACFKAKNRTSLLGFL